MAQKVLELDRQSHEPQDEASELEGIPATSENILVLKPAKVSHWSSQVTGEDWELLLSKPWPPRFKKVLELFRENNNERLTLGVIKEQTGIWFSNNFMRKYFLKFELPFDLRADGISKIMEECGRKIFKKSG